MPVQQMKIGLKMPKFVFKIQGKRKSSGMSFQNFLEWDGCVCVCVCCMGGGRHPNMLSV